jgi:hypothetical protein
MLEKFRAKANFLKSVSGNILALYLFQWKAII